MFCSRADKTVYQLDDQNKPEAFAGQKVEVTGNLKRPPRRSTSQISKRHRKPVDEGRAPSRPLLLPEKTNADRLARKRTQMKRWILAVLIVLGWAPWW